MKNTADPSVHRQRERQFIEHVERLLVDPRLRPETVNGAKPITTLMPQATRADRAMDLKNEMVRMNLTDRELQNRMPVGESIDVSMSTKKWLIFKKPVGRMRVVCTSPTKALLGGDQPKPMTPQELTRLLTEQPPALGGVPSTLVIMATHGFTLEAHELTDRRPDRTVILAEPNDAGGWSVYGPPEQKALVDLFDPEADQEKRSRVREAIEADRSELLTSGLSAERIATRAQLPLQLVESELKSYAKQNAGLQAKRLDGHVVLFGTESVAAPAPASKGSVMPFLDNLRNIFRRDESPERKIERLAEQRAGLLQQRQRLYEVVESLEKREDALVGKFGTTTSDLTQQRIAAEVTEVREDMRRRHQLLSALDKKLTIVQAATHKIEMERTVNADSLKELQDLAGPPEELEEGMAALDQMTEEADAMTSFGASEPSAKVQSVLDELRAKQKTTTAPANEPTKGRTSQASTSASASPARSPTRTPAESPKRAEPEAG